MIIDATQWFRVGDHANVSGRTIPEYYSHIIRCGKCGHRIESHGDIKTLEGKGAAQEVCPGDWIITGVKGENYPCKPDIFAATYDEAIEEPAQ